MQAFVHFSALCTRRKVGGTDRFKLRRVPERDAALTLTRLYRVCAKVLRAEGILRGKSGPRDATPPSSRRPRRRRRRRRLFLLCVKTAGVLARIRVKSGVEGSAAERMERSCYFGKLSGRHERIDGGGGEGRGRQTHVGACHDPLHQSTVRRFSRNFADGPARDTPRKVHGFVLLLPTPPPGDFLRWLCFRVWLSGLSSPFLSGRWLD